MNIISFNVNGLSQKNKSIAIFEKLAKFNSISLLQETHSTIKTEKIWKDDWKGNIYFSHGSSNSKGVAILIPHNIQYDIEDKITDEDGRILILKIKLNNTAYIICNIYAPTLDHKVEQINFSKRIQNKLFQFENENIILGGDFNLYFNLKVDKQDNMKNKCDNINYRNEILSLLDVFNLTDAWRELFPETRRYTWHARGKSSRLDYFFLSEYLMNDLTSYKIIPGLHSDHSILSLTFNNTNKNRGRGFWKFNNILLHDIQYVKNIKNILKECKSKYSNTQDKGLVWELCKLEIRSYSVPYCIKRKKERSAFKRNLEDELEKLTITLDNSPSEDLQNAYNITKKELEEIEKEITKLNAIIFRSKAKWTEDGGKNTKYFLNLEKNNYTNKLITNLEVSGKLISDNKDISKEVTNFYNNLYTEKLNEHDISYKTLTDVFFNNINTTKRSEIQKNYCDNPISE
jgi:exonuclease III